MSEHSAPEVELTAARSGLLGRMDLVVRALVKKFERKIKSKMSYGEAVT